MIVRIINRIIYVVQVSILNWITILKLTTKKHKKELFICDIDNTIADTWPSLVDPPSDVHYLYQNLPVLIGPGDYVRGKMSEDNNIVFLTARDEVYYDDTKKWLKKNNFWISGKCNLLLVKKAQHKLFHIKYLVRKYEVIYMDDLSYNHEHGVVLFYDEMIDNIRSLNLTYIDYSAILRMTL